jgi:hypothetical protein
MRLPFETRSHGPLLRMSRREVEMRVERFLRGSARRFSAKTALVAGGPLWRGLRARPPSRSRRSGATSMPIDAKRRTTAYLREPPLLVEAVW